MRRGNTEASSSQLRTTALLAQLDGKVISGARAVYDAAGQPTGALELLVRFAQSDNLETVRLARGSTLALELQARYCPGYTDRDGSHHHCPDYALADNQDGLWHCDSCIGRHHVSRAMKEQSSVRPERRLREEPHVVYLAADPEHVKVGTARAERTHFRLAEQGARAARILCTLASEAEALQLEEAIKGLRYDDRADRHARARSLGQQAPADALLAHLDHLIRIDIRPRLSHRFQLDRPEEMASVLIRQPLLPRTPQSCKNLAAGSRLSGTVEAAAAGVLILDDNGQLAAYSLRSLGNWQVRVLAEDELPQQQLGLFDPQEAAA